MHIVILPRRAAVQARFTAFPGIKKAPAGCKLAGAGGSFYWGSGGQGLGGSSLRDGSSGRNGNQQNILAVDLVNRDAGLLNTSTLQQASQNIHSLGVAAELALLDEVLLQERFRPSLLTCAALTFIRYG